MSEKNSPRYVEWDYVLIGPDGAWDDGFRKRWDYPQVGEWHVEFMGRTRDDELIIARYYPSEDEDAQGWLQAFESESASGIPVSIDAYFGPTDYPKEPHFEDYENPHDLVDVTDHPGPELVDVAHTIYVGTGWARLHENEVVITIPPDVFNDAAASLLMGFQSNYDHIERRVFRVFEMLSPREFSEFWSTFRRPAYPNDAFSFNDDCREALWRNRPIRFDRPSELDCLKLLDSASGETVSYTILTSTLHAISISENVRQTKASPELRTCISHLRASLRAVGCRCEIENVYGRGYRLIPSR